MLKTENGIEQKKIDNSIAGFFFTHIWDNRVDLRLDNFVDYIPYIFGSCSDASYIKKCTSER